MNTLSPLYFPDSIINTPIKLSLAAFFHDIQLLKPVEESDQQPSPQSNDCVTDNTFCQVHIPCPLADKDRQGFLHLVKDIRTQGSAFVTQLKMLTLADMSSPGRQEPESSQKILSALFPQEKDRQQKNDRETALDLWQARLILKLAEIIDEEERLVAKEMGSINLLETRMLRELQGSNDTKTDDPFIHPGTILSPQESQSATIRKRVKAWSTLYRYWNAQDLPVWVTSRPEAADIVLEKYEKMKGEQSCQLLHLSLPVFDVADEKNTTTFYEKVRQFRTDTDQMRNQLTNMLIHALKTEPEDHRPPATPLEGTETIKKRWQETLNNHFPLKTYGRTTLTSYLLSDMTFGKIVDKKEGAQSPFNNAILSVIESAASLKPLSGHS